MSFWLTARNTSWCQYAYQFAHEHCHVLSGYERLQLEPNQWFHESICELASLFTLKQMAKTWQTSPPYEPWREFAPKYSEYTDDLLSKSERQLPAGVSLAEWFPANEPMLRANAVNRDLNGVVAAQLLPIFQASPTYWQAVQYMPNTDESFTAFLSAWRDACPADLRPTGVQRRATLCN